MDHREELPLVEVKDLKKYFYGRKSALTKKQTVLKAVDRVSFSVPKGTTVGLVGESGCGKSTLGRTILKLHSVTDGRIFFKGEDITDYNIKQMRAVRTSMQMIFQDPYNSLNPRKINFDSVKSALTHVSMSEAEKNETVAEMLAYVGISPENYYKFPHELSGGQRQRVVIARAMVSSPEFIVCDEPVSALDVSVRSQVLNLMKEIQEKKGLSYLFISHDMSVIKFLCDQIAVMYLGHIVEYAPAAELFANPLHPYTKALLSSIPIPDVDHVPNRIILQGDIPSPANPPMGCPFQSRCPYAMEECTEQNPELKVVEGNHKTACCRIGEIN